ncbi:transcriptional regulator with XRE-family HTH domain [Bosea sp. BE125]|jgi:transcriptional regulator with XRE-family HTH domain|uniref:helix-turn-helix domain-containing protein n=1 Tax=Bosea sp. BE125 TaxID=2817909 RepID=UPI00285D6770|nr:XRE family transcriptional regulator [Bosea sp. BE125]MDR6872591.1 transcriptional regulator with XRE-family HTH domain [Bosea sp. BE125]
MPVTKKNAIRSGLSDAATLAATVMPARFSAAEARAEDSPVDLGLRLKRMRVDNGWTLEDVSQRTGVARSTLSKIENGQMSPTYDVLQKITRGTGLDIVELFDARRQNAPFGRRSVTKRGEGKPHLTGAYRYEVLATDLSQKQILPFKARVTARSLDDFPGWVRHEGEEFLCVLSGRVQVFTEFYSPVVLEVGDSTYFDSKMGHAVVSLSDEDAEILWICTGITALE